MRILKGVIIGAGAILPGISGGVLSAVFGIYRPLMELFSAPVEGIRKHWRLLFPIGIGWLLGFVLFADAIAVFIGKAENTALWLFIGMIAGTVPGLLRDAAKEGRSRGGYCSMLLCFAALSAILLWADQGFSETVEPNLFWFYFCGILWGFSLIVPGMTSSSILMSLNLFEPMAKGLGRLAPSVVIPMVFGTLTIVLLLSRFVNRLFRNHYCIASHGILGFVFASTLVIIPLHYRSWGEFFLSIAVGIAGFVVTVFSERRLKDLERKYSDS